MQKILVISNHNEIKDDLARLLRDDSIGLEHSPSPQEGLEKWQNTKPDLVILDINLSKLDGKDICQIMKEKNDQSKIIFINFEKNELQALSNTPNPLRKQELESLISDIKNLLSQNGHLEFSFDGNLVDYKNYTAINKDERQYYLSEREIEIFRLFSRNPNKLIRREQILEEVWQDDIYPSSLTIERKINKLRKIFESDAQTPKYFHSIPGMGYKFTPKGNQE